MECSPSAERLAAEIEKFNAPDRHVMQLNVEKMLSHDLNRLLEVEKMAQMSGVDSD